MCSFEIDQNLSHFARGIVRRKVKQLTRRPEFSDQDREDLEQDLFVRVVQSLQRYDSQQGHINVFVTTVVERYVANLIRDRKVAKRTSLGIASLNVMVDINDEGPTEFAQTIGDRELDSRLGRERLPQPEVDQLAIDLAEVIATLPEPWRRLLELRKTLSMPEAAREMGIPRTTLNDWMARIREHFEAAGFRAHLEP